MEDDGQRSVILYQRQQTKPPQRKRKARRQSGYLRRLYKPEERREVKSKGERERQIQLKTELQRTAQRSKKAFFNEQCIKLEENNRRGKTRDLFRKIRDIKGTLCPEMGPRKDTNGKDLVDTEEIKKRWKEYMEELYKKELSEPDYYEDVVSHPEPDILETEVKWALGSITMNKASGCD